MTTVAECFAKIVGADPARPLLTFYDDATGERTELSGATLDNWVAKTANLLVDGCGLGPGAAVASVLPPHWLTAAVLLGAWHAGLAVTHAVTYGQPTLTGGPPDVAFAAADRLEGAGEWRAGELYGLSLAPFATPLREVPPGVSDFVVEVRAYGDHFTGPPVDPAAPALGGLPGGAPPLSHAQLAERAAARAAELDLSGTDRVLIPAPTRPLDWLLAPLFAGASIVLCRNAEESRLADRAATERVTRTL